MSDTVHVRLGTGHTKDGQLPPSGYFGHSRIWRSLYISMSSQLAIGATRPMWQRGFQRCDSTSVCQMDVIRLVDGGREESVQRNLLMVPEACEYLWLSKPEMARVMMSV